MIELDIAPTPKGHKISITLEEVKKTAQKIIQKKLPLYLHGKFQK